jgi:hypothetical protein
VVNYRVAGGIGLSSLRTKGPAMVWFIFSSLRGSSR